MSSFFGEADYIYLQDHREDKDFVIEIPLDDTNLATKLDDITECLRLEFAPIEIWHRIGVELYRLGLDSKCNKLLATALEDDLKAGGDWSHTVSTYEGSPENRINLLNAATVQAINAITTSKEDIRRATQYYQLARRIAEKSEIEMEEIKRYNIALLFTAGLIQMEKAKHKNVDISQLLTKTKHDLTKAIEMREFNDDEEDERVDGLERDPDCSAVLCIATLSYSTGEYEEALKNYTKLLRMSLRNGDDTNYYLGFVHLGIGMSALKLKEFDIARHAFRRAKELDRFKNNRFKDLDEVRLHDKAGYVGAKARVGLALVYLNEYSYPENEANDKEKRKKRRKWMRNALQEITDAMRHCPNNPQLLVLMANFVGFSCHNTRYAKMWAGTAYAHCQQITKLIEKEPDDHLIQGGLDQKFCLRSNFNVHSVASLHNSSTTATADSPLSTCLHPLAQCQAEAAYVIGKLYHVAKDYDMATKWYYKSVVLAPYFVLALFGLSQMYIDSNHLDHAKVCLERILKLNTDRNVPNDSKVQSHYAFVCRQLGDHEKAKQHLERATQMNPDAVDLWIDLAEITERKDPDYAIKKYIKAMSIMKKRQILNGKRNQNVPFELFNNIIVLFYELGNYQKAKTMSMELIAITNELPINNHNHNNNSNGLHGDGRNGSSNGTVNGKENGSKVIPPHQMVIQYNLARILDELCEYKKARKIYRQILMSSPSFIEAILCNALYLHHLGRYPDAIKKLEEAASRAAEYKEVNIQMDALLYIHRIQSQIGKRRESEETLSKIEALTKSTTNHLVRTDEYSKLVKANYWLSANRNRNHYYKALHSGLREYQTILVTNPSNLYAVHGFGVIAAEAREAELAKAILSKLRDCHSGGQDQAFPCNADMIVNLGHVYSQYQQWDLALKHYEKARKRLKPHQQGDIPLYIVRTLFAKKDFAAAKRHLHQLLRQHPTQELYLYNLALVEEEFACDILRKDPKKRTLKEIEDVMEMLETAKRIYKRLDNNKKTAMTIPHDKLKQHLDHIRNELLENARKHLEFQRAEEERKEKRRKLEERKLAKSLEKERREKERKEREELIKKQEARRKAMRAKEKGATIEFKEPTEGNSQRANSGRKRKRSSSEYADIREEEPMERKRMRRNEATKDDGFGHHMDQFEKGGEETEYGGRFEEEEEPDLLADEESEKKKLKKKKKKKKKNKGDKKKKKKGEMNEEEWLMLEAKIEDIVRHANLNELTNRQVKKQLAECFPDVNIKSYKQRIKEKINAVAAELAQPE